MSFKSYKIERRIYDISKWWQKSNNVGYWCLVEYGSRYFYSNGGSSVYVDDIEYEKVILKSEDYSIIKKELDYHNGVFPNE